MSTRSLNSNLLAPHTPTAREELWRFTPLNKLRGLHDVEVSLASRVSLQERSQSTLPQGAAITIVDASTLAPISKTDDLVSLRVRGSAEKALVLNIEANAEIAQPIFLTRTFESLNPEVSRTRIIIGSNARATVVVENSGSITLAEELEMELGTGSTLNFVSLQEWENDAVHLGHHHAVIGKDATFNSTVITLGGSLVRLLPTVDYAGPGASAELSGLYFATGGQHLEHRVHVDHNLPHAKSRVNYKGALHGDNARTVWFGDVFIHANAEGTDTYEVNRNLLLSDGARADSVPNLEIETGEIVGAGHASTTGRFDDEQLFYLESRGIPTKIARQLVIRGFFLEIVSALSRLGLSEIEERIMNRIEVELEKAAV
jgi:Fe-S cluster assembly protein SufD